MAEFDDVLKEILTLKSFESEKDWRNQIKNDSDETLKTFSTFLALRKKTEKKDNSIDAKSLLSAINPKEKSPEEIHEQELKEHYINSLSKIKNYLAENDVNAQVKAQWFEGLAPKLDFAKKQFKEPEHQDIFWELTDLLTTNKGRNNGILHFKSRAKIRAMVSELEKLGYIPDEKNEIGDYPGTYFVNFLKSGTVERTFHSGFSIRAFNTFYAEINRQHIARFGAGMQRVKEFDSIITISKEVKVMLDGKLVKQYVQIRPSEKGKNSVPMKEGDTSKKLIEAVKKLL
jgi:hypothetical protein